MIGIVLALLLFGLVGLRFVRRVRQESRRQRALTWPRATAVLAGEDDALVPAATNRHGDIVFYHARLQEPYVFYARGERQTGHRLAPELERLNPEEAKLFLRALGKHRSYQVCYDPQHPERNYLTVGRHLLSNRTLLLYAVFGVVLPASLAYLSSYVSRLAVPEQLAVYGGILIILVLALAVFYAAKAVFNLGTLLQPATQILALPEEPAGDALLESLATRPATAAAAVPETLPPAAPPKTLRS